MEGIYIILILIVSIALFVLGVMLYFLPAFIAYKKNHANKNIILLLNFLFGWTFLGWAGCLIWACIDTDGATADRAFRNVGGNKYEDLEKLQKLKDDGSLSESELEVEKQKVLNSSSTAKPEISNGKTAFIIEGMIIALGLVGAILVVKLCSSPVVQ